MTTTDVFVCLILILSFSGCAEGATASENIQRNTVYETSFTSSRDYANPFADVEMKVRFTSPSGKVSTIDAFWDGGKTWRVRFSPTETGEWRWKSDCSDTGNSGLHGKAGSFQCVPYIGRNKLFIRGPLRLCADSTHFEHADGTPFFWMSDTAWNGVLKARSADWNRYLSTRQSQGFTAVQFVSTHWRAFDKDEKGEIAFEGDKNIKVNPEFFRRLDGKVKAINEKGLIASPVILWAVSKTCVGQALLEEDAVRLARYIVARWGAHQVVWMLGGDGNYLGERTDRWRRIGRAVFGDWHDRLVTMHPGGTSWCGEELRREFWFDFIGYQSGHGDSDNALKWLTQGPPAINWAKQPIRPVINLEPNYEAIKANHSKQPFDAHKVRRALYWSLMVSPTAGVTYGHHGIWSWAEQREVPLNHPNNGEAPPWHEALNSEGAQSVKHLMSFFTSIEWWRLRPAPKLVANQPSEPRRFISAAGTEAGDLAVVYIPEGRAVRLNADLTQGLARARWFNPRSRQWIPAQAKDGEYACPDEEDWVLCLTSK